MKFTIPNNLTHNTQFILRQAGYLYIFDKISQHGSFVRELTRERYPRFHLYIMENKEEITFDLHLDQAQARYQGQKAHRADYETEEVKVELTRIYHLVTKYKR